MALAVTGVADGCFASAMFKRYKSMLIMIYFVRESGFYRYPNTKKLYPVSLCRYLVFWSTIALGYKLTAATEPHVDLFYLLGTCFSRDCT